MNPIKMAERTIRRFDRFQARHTVVAFPIAVVKKYGDDQGSRLAALIAFYGFFSFFPLMLVFVSVLGFVLADNPQLRDQLVDSAFGQFPVIGRAMETRAGVEPLEGNWAAVVVGAIAALWAGLGVAQASQNAMNTIWGIPRSKWPNFFFRRVRALAMLAVLGTIVIASTFASGLGSAGAWIPSEVGWVAAFLLNVVLFTLAYQILTATSLRWVNVLPGAVVAALGWTILQAVGSYVVTNQIQSASDVYGTFALVIVLLVWISLGAQLTLYCAEINVVLREHLWPRNIAQPPLSEGDRRVYAAIVERAAMRPEVTVNVAFEPADDGTDTRDGSDETDHEDGADNTQAGTRADTR